MPLRTINKFIGLSLTHVSHAEKLASTVGGITGIYLIAWISYLITGASGAALIVPSMGASAVLVFAVPHGQLSQPWSVFGGHLCSALIGVTCYQLIPELFLAAGLAVGLAIGAMHVLRCIHPPGGATALTAVIGGEAIHNLGYSYALTPILLNCVIILIVAFVFNSFFPWRRYPAAMMRFNKVPPSILVKPPHLTTKHIKLAIEEMDLVIDATIEDLQQLYEYSLRHAQQHTAVADIHPGHYYSNGREGTFWSIRQIIEESPDPDPNKAQVTYRVADGYRVNSTGSCTRAEFAEWADHEVIANTRK